ncbi:MAG: periplasmic heavy metal sensor [Betaproteobacteria bacterium]|nr:periplasmic heavy metal sensor [Betaproteobacteria bacterium]
MSGLSRSSRKIALALALCAGLSALPAAAERGHGGDHFVHAIAAFKAQLNLNTQQQGYWDAAVASGKAAREAARQSRLTVKQVASEEMAKTTPDLSRIAAAADQVRDANTAAQRQVRTQWLQLYATFSPDQVAVVKAGMARQMERMERFREHMRHRFGGN